MGNSITIIGAGPAGLFAADLLLKKDFKVDLYDASSGVAKKFLIAGNGGLNLTHSEDIANFASRYGKDAKLFLELLNEFSPLDLRDWCHELGVETFIGTSGRVFPKKLKAGEIVVKWLNRLKANPNFSLHLNHKFIAIDSNKNITFENSKIKGQTVLFALGGASWKKTGSDGSWKQTIEDLGIKVKDFLPMNCGFETNWSEYFVKNVDRHHLKNVALTHREKSVRSELMLTPFGIEGSAIYALSNSIRDDLLENKKATISLDLKPDLSFNEIKDKLSKRKSKDSLSNYLRKAFAFDKKTNVLLHEIIPKDDFNDHPSLANYIKNLPITFKGIRPLDEAISTSGGVCFDQLSKSFESKKVPGLFFIGEMLDFEAPTGGYLLQGCFSTSFRACQKIINHKSEF